MGTRVADGKQGSARCPGSSSPCSCALPVQLEERAEQIRSKSYLIQVEREKIQMELSHKRARVELERAASTSARNCEVGPPGVLCPQEDVSCLPVPLQTWKAGLAEAPVAWGWGTGLERHQVCKGLPGVLGGPQWPFCSRGLQSPLPSR